MKRFAAPLLVVLIIAVGGFTMMRRASTRAETLEKEASLLRIQRDYLERVSYVRGISDPKAFTEEANTLFRWYFKEIGDHQKRFNTNADFDDYLIELEARGGKDAQVNERKAYFQHVKKTLETMREGAYRPVWSGNANGLRLDVLSADVKMVAGTPMVRYSLALWGAQRELRVDGNVKRMVTSASFNVKWNLLGAKAKVLGEIEANGDPSMKIDWPERYISEFPPQMVFGHYDVDLIPADVETAEITFNVSSRSATGGDAVAQLTWKLPVPSEWKLRAGEQWKDATVTERGE